MIKPNPGFIDLSSDSPGRLKMMETSEGCLYSSLSALDSGTTPRLCNSCSQTCNRLQYAWMGVVINRAELRGDTQEECSRFPPDVHVQFANAKRLHVTSINGAQSVGSRLLYCGDLLQVAATVASHRFLQSSVFSQCPPDQLLQHLTSCQYQHSELTPHGPC